jgi:hypothetical protein
MTKIAIVQEPPVFLNREQTIAKAVQKLKEAAARGAELIVFNEAFVPGYPAWIWRLKPSGDWGLSETLHARLVANAVDLSSDQLKPLCDAASKAGVGSFAVVVCAPDGQRGAGLVKRVLSEQSGLRRVRAPTSLHRTTPLPPRLADPRRCRPDLHPATGLTLRNPRSSAPAPGVQRAQTGKTQTRSLACAGQKLGGNVSSDRNFAVKFFNASCMSLTRDMRPLREVSVQARLL